MSDAKPYTTEEQVRSAVSLDLMHVAAADRTIATVRALDAAQAEVTALRAKLDQPAHAHLDGAHVSAPISTCVLCLEIESRAALRARVAELEAGADNLCGTIAGLAELRDRLVAERDEWKALAEKNLDAQQLAQERDEWKAKFDKSEADLATCSQAHADALVARDEWKAKAEAAERDKGNLEFVVAALTLQRDEAAALTERLREVLDATLWMAEKWADSEYPGHPARDACESARAALATPAPAWFAERDRALAVRVAEAVRDACASCCDHDEGSTERIRDTSLAAIVDEILKEKS